MATQDGRVSRPCGLLRAVAVGRPSGYNLVMRPNPPERKPKKRPKPGDAVQEASDYGIDIAALRDNLARTVGERLRRHQIALDRMRMLQKAKRL
jgi:hypothetical protein